MSTGPAPVSEMSRDELEDEVEELREDVDWLQNRLFRLEDMITGERDLGAVEDQYDSPGGLIDAVESEANGSVSSAGISDDVRDRMLPIHEMWIDVRQDRLERLPGDNARRAARIFGRFIQKASGEHSVGIDATYGTYSVTSSDAREQLEEADDMTNTGKSMTVKRVFRMVQRLSKVKDCDCNSIDECDHGLIQFNPGTPNTLVSQKDRFNQAMDNVESAIEVDITEEEKASSAGEDDEQRETEEDDDDVMAEFDRLSAAEEGRR